MHSIHQIIDFLRSSLLKKLSKNTLFSVFLILLATPTKAQGPNPQTGMRVVGTVKLSASCEEDTLAMENLTKDTARTVKFYVHSYNYFNNPIYPNYKDTFYTKGNGSHVYKFDDSLALAKCLRSVDLYFGIIAYDSFGVDYPVISRIKIYLKPRALFSMDPLICGGDQIKLHNQSCKDSTKFKWFYDDTFSTAFEPQNIHFDSTGKKTIKFVASTSAPCVKSDTLQQTIEVLRKPEPGFNIVNTVYQLYKDSVVCSGDTLYLINRAKHSDSIHYIISPPGSYQLIGGTQLYDDTVKLLMQNKGTITYEQTAFNKACNRSVKKILKLIINPVVAISPILDCIDSNHINLNNFVDTANGLPRQTIWHFSGNGQNKTITTLFPGTLQGLQYGQYKISVTSIGTCRTVTNKDSFFVAPPLKKPNDFTICQGLDSTIQLNRLFNFPKGFKPQWTGAVSSDSLFQSKNKLAGNYPLTLTDKNSSCYQLTINVEILGGATQLPDQHLCYRNPTALSLDNLLPANYSGTGVKKDTFYSQLAGPGIFPIKYTTVFKTCTFTEKMNVFVHDTFTPRFTFITPGCLDSGVVFTKNTTEKTILWDFGNGATSNSDQPTYYYKKPGTYKVSLMAGNYCPDTLTQPITIYPGPNIQLKVIADTLSCDSTILLAYFSNKGYGEKYSVTYNKITYQGDSIRIAINKSFQSRTIQLIGTAISKCGKDTSLLKVRIPQRNTAAIEILGLNPGCHGDSLRLVNASYGPIDSFIIDYGNGKTSKNKILKLPYFNNTSALKTFPIIMTVYTNYCGVLTDTAFYKVIPNVIRAAGEQNKVKLCNYDMVTFINNSTQGTAFNLYFGDGGSTKGSDYRATVNYQYKVPGVYVPYIKALSACGNDSATLDTIVVNGAPNFNLVNTQPKMCLGSEIYIKYAPSNLLHPLWFVNSQLTDSLVNPFTFHPKSLGKYRISVLLANQFCIGLDSFDVLVEPAPSLKIDVTELTCDTIKVKITGDYELGQLEVNWGDGVVDFGKLYHVYLDTGEFLVKMKLLVGTCTLYFERYVTVKQGPHFKVITEPKLSDCLNPGDILNIAIALDSMPYQVELYNWAGERICQNCERKMLDVKYSVCAPAQYKIVVRDKDNCKAENKISFDCFDPNITRYKAFVPNAFTPKNGDVLNDIYIPKLAYYEAGMNYTLRIYNRWGELLFETDNPNEGWDGIYKDKVCQMDVYVYVIEYGCPSHAYNKHRGTFHLLR